MLEMLRRTRSTFRLDEEACEDQYHATDGRCYTAYMEDPKPRGTTAPKPRSTAAEEGRRTESKPGNNVPAEAKSTAPEPTPNSSTTAAAMVPVDPKSSSLKPVGLGILIQAACRSRESKVRMCNKPMAIQTFPKNVDVVSSCFLPDSPPNVISTRSSPSSNNPNSSFLKVCHLCKKNLRQDKDIFMYRGDLGFCSSGCRSRRMFLDEMEEKERLVKAKAAPAARCRRRSVQNPRADGRSGVLAMA